MATPARQPGELTDIEVARLDGVDKPATRRRWLIMKGEGALTMDPKALEQSALALMENLSKDAGAEGLAMSEASLGALNGLAKSLGLTTAFKAKAAPPPPPQVPPAPPVADDPTKDPMACRIAKMEEGLAAVTKSIGDLVAKSATVPPAAPAPASAPTAVAKSVDGAPAAGVTPPPSTQPRGQDVKPPPAEREYGKGMFANVLFAGSPEGGR